MCNLLKLISPILSQFAFGNGHFISHKFWWKTLCSNDGSGNRMYLVSHSILCKIFLCSSFIDNLYFKAQTSEWVATKVTNFYLFNYIV